VRCQMQLETALGLSLFHTKGPARETGAAWMRALARRPPQRYRVSNAGPVGAVVSSNEQRGVPGWVGIC
jgi:hypothetical protein